MVLNRILTKFMPSSTPLFHGYVLAHKIQQILVAQLFAKRTEDVSTTFTDSSCCSILLNLFKFKESTCKSTIALINPLKLLPVATRQTFRCKYAFLTDSNALLGGAPALKQKRSTESQYTSS